MELEIIHNTEALRFETHIDESTAFVQYAVKGEDVIAITSTQVPKALEGRGIAAALTKFVLEYARTNNLTVIPICSYTVAYFEKHTEYSDLLSSDN